MNSKIIKKEKLEWNSNFEFYVHDQKSLYKKFLNEKALKFFQIKTGTVVDIGCATGEFLEILPDKCKKYGVDFSNIFIKYAQINRPNIEFIKSGAEKIPFKNNYFDAVILKGTLHHLKAQGILISSMQEIDRVLKNGGKVFIHDRCNSVLGKFIHEIAIKLRQKMKQLNVIHSTCASDFEPNFGIEDLSYLINTKKFRIIKQKYVLNVIFFFIVCFTNTVQYIFGFTIAQVLRLIFFPLVVLTEQVFCKKNLTVEEFIILKK